MEQLKCKICNTELKSHKTDLLKHGTISKHKLKANAVGKNQLTMQKVGIFKSNQETKKKEIILATYIAMHSTVCSIDHLTDVINMNWSAPSSSTSAISQSDDLIRLHRTKCTALIKHVIAPSLLLDLIKDVGNSAFSIIT